MKRKERRTFSSEFKKEILARVAQGEAPADLANQHKLTVSLICSWKRQMRDEELDLAVDHAPRVQQSGVNPKYVRSLEEKLREANEKLGELYIVVEALKKTEPGYTKNANSYIASGVPWAPLKRRAR